MSYEKWTEEQLNDLRDNYLYYLEHKEEAENKFKRKWINIAVRSSQLKISSIKQNKSCPQFLGCNIAERYLSKVFKNVERMINNNPGYDFICNKGFKIDVKSSCLNKNNSYTFSINQNKIADYFLLIAFDNRTDLNPQHLWLIKGELMNEIKILQIYNTDYSLEPFKEYELNDKLKETIECCNTLRRLNHG